MIQTKVEKLTNGYLVETWGEADKTYCKTLEEVFTLMLFKMEQRAPNYNGPNYAAVKVYDTRS